MGKDIVTTIFEILTILLLIAAVLSRLFMEKVAAYVGTMQIADEISTILFVASGLSAGIIAIKRRNSAKALNIPTNSS